MNSEHKINGFHFFSRDGKHFFKFFYRSCFLYQFFFFFFSFINKDQCFSSESASSIAWIVRPVHTVLQQWCRRRGKHQTLFKVLTHFTEHHSRDVLWNETLGDIWLSENASVAAAVKLNVNNVNISCEYSRDQAREKQKVRVLLTSSSGRVKQQPEPESRL